MDTTTGLKHAIVKFLDQYFDPSVTGTTFRKVNFNCVLGNMFCIEGSKSGSKRGVLSWHFSLLAEVVNYEEPTLTRYLCSSICMHGAELQ